MGMRLFAAVVPPLAVLEELDAFVAPRREAGGPWRWTAARTWHLTTAFMGDTAEADLEPLVENLRAAASRTPSFDLRLGGGGCFPHPYGAKVLVLGVVEGADELTTLARRSRTAAERAGVRTDGARFTPHLTLARTNRGVEATRWLRVLDAAPPVAWWVDELQLVWSHLHDRGNRYEVVASLPLGPGGPPGKTRSTTPGDRP